MTNETRRTECQASTPPPGRTWIPEKKARATGIGTIIEGNVGVGDCPGGMRSLPVVWEKGDLG